MIYHKRIQEIQHAQDVLPSLYNIHIVESIVYTSYVAGRATTRCDGAVRQGHGSVPLIQSIYSPLRAPEISDPGSNLDARK